MGCCASKPPAPDKTLHEYVDRLPAAERAAAAEIARVAQAAGSSNRDVAVIASRTPPALAAPAA